MVFFRKTEKKRLVLSHSKATFLFLLMFCIAQISLVSATTTVSTFNNSLSAENLTFTGNENITRWLSVPEDTFLTSGELNITGKYYGRCVQETANQTACNDYGLSGDDYLWESVETWAGRIYMNYTIPESANQSQTIWQVKHGNLGLYNVSIPEGCHVSGKVRLRLYSRVFSPAQSYGECYNGSGWEVVTNISSGSDGSCIDVGSLYDIYDGNYSTEISLTGGTYGGICRAATPSKLYEEAIIWNNLTEFDIINNFTLYIGNLKEEVNGILNTTYLLDELKNILNPYINSCSIIGGYCNIPFKFNSATPGILRYFALEFSNDGFLENSQAFESSVLESTGQTFSLNMTYDSSEWSSITAKLQYNGTNYTATSTGSGDNLNFSKTFDVPDITGTENIEFYWIVALTNVTGTFEYNSETNNQSVSSISLDICAPGDTPYFTFNTKDAADSVTDVNSTFKATWNIYESSGSGSLVINQTYQDLTEANNTWSFCFSDNSTDYTVTAQIEYDSSNHAKNFYYINEQTYTITTTEITLYLLNDSFATLTEFEVRDASSQASLEDVYITVQRYDVGTDTFYTTAMMKSSSEGKDLSYLNWYDTLYKFILVKDGSVIYTTTPFKISETPQIFEVTTESTYEFDKFNDFEYSLTFNNATNNFVLTFIKPSGAVEAGCLYVIKRNITNDYEICNVCETSSSATLYCNIDNQGNGTFLAGFYATGSHKWIDWIPTFIGLRNEIYELIGNEDGTAMTIIFAGVIMSLFFFSAVAAILGLIIGMVGAFALGFQPMDYLSFMGLLAVGGVVIWHLRR